MPQCRNKLHIPIKASNSAPAAGDLQLPVLLLLPISLLWTKMPPLGLNLFHKDQFHPVAALLSRKCHVFSPFFSYNRLISSPSCFTGIWCRLHKVEFKYRPSMRGEIYNTLLYANWNTMCLGVCYANVLLRALFNKNTPKKNESVFMQYLWKVKCLSPASKANGLTLQWYLPKAAPTPCHPKLRGRDQWEVRVHDHRCRK